MAELVGALVPRFCRKRVSKTILVSKISAHAVRPRSLSSGVNSIFRGPHDRFFDLSASDRVIFNVRGGNVPCRIVLSHCRRAVQRLRVRGLGSHGLFSLSNKRGRAVTFTDICTLGPSVFILSRPSSGLSPRTVRRLQQLLLLVGTRKGAVIMSRRHLCFLGKVTSHVILVRRNGLGRS